ncbi:hypothetical protein F5Y13DRAFT_194236 [Hypoxylon sp. FL1857]|nr:hypothetical protein F5Y13DRAFT_194236 [Hypoxylon sp. FL1857]
MACRMPECHHIRPNGSRSKLNHDKDSRPGAAFYYCSIHRVYHCITVKYHRRLPQPLCGECAWLFYNFPKEATNGVYEQPSGREISMIGVTDTMTPARSTRPLPTIEETLDNLTGRVRGTNTAPQGNRRKRARRGTNSTSTDEAIPSRSE